jgi:serine/threonine-protein kinase
MGEVIHASYDTDDGVTRPAVIKRILPTLSRVPLYLKAFRHEAWVSQLFHHPNVVQAFDYGTGDDGNPFLVMEHLEGLDLQTVLRECYLWQIPIPVELSLQVMGDVLRGLQHIHSRRSPATGELLGVVHRDLCPGNIFLTRRGTVKVLDFGIARTLARTETNPAEWQGSACYLSPEQVVGAPVDHRSDLFVCGTLLYELVTGIRPFRGATDHEIRTSVLEARVPDPSSLNPGLSERLDYIIDIALARNPDHRFQDGATFARALDSVLTELDFWPDGRSLTSFIDLF